MSILTSLFFVAATGLASPQATDLKALDGEWIFMEDRTEGRPLENVNPPMNSRFIFKVEEGAVILVWGHGGNGNRNVNVKPNGEPTEIAGPAAGAATRYRGSWKDGVFSYDMEFLQDGALAPGRQIKRSFQLTKEGLIVRSNLQLTPGVDSVGFYKQAKDIPMPTPAKATINDLSWISGNWAGTRSTGSTFEERWSPPKGGAMLATSRSVNARGQMFAFEYLRIMEKEGGLVYVAQPNGAAGTEFVLTEFSAKKAVFENPRHDFPKKIVYELTDGGLTATIGYIKGGTPRKFEFKREGSSTELHNQLPR